MLILVSALLMFLTALVLLILRFARPKFQFTWLVAAGGAILALVSVFLWQLHLPQTFSFFTWQPQTVFAQTPAWLGDKFSWPYAVCLAGLAVAAILTSIVRSDIDPLAWVGILLLTALGLLVVTSVNPLTLVMVWSALDLAELVAMLASTEGEKPSGTVMVAFVTRLCGSGLVLWVYTVYSASGQFQDLQTTPTQAGIFLLCAIGLRLGILPLHLPYRHENSVRRGFGTVLRLVSAASSLALLAHIPVRAIATPLTPYLLFMAALTAIYAGWKWMRASDELSGRPFWVLGMSALAIASALRGNPTGSIAWGVTLVLGGGILFLYSARQRTLSWLLMLSLYGLSSLPFSATASSWQSGISVFPLLWIILLPAQALLMTGFIRHALHPGDSSLESQPLWAQVIYPLGLTSLVTILILLGLWGWDGTFKIGLWWAALFTLALVGGLVWLVFRVLPRFGTPRSANQWGDLLGLNWMYDVIWGFYRFLEHLSSVITGTLEGDGGILWSFLLLVLILSVFSSRR